MMRDRNIAWLLESSGPIVRYRTKTELHRFANTKDRENTVAELLGCTEVRKWMKLLAESSHLHGSDSYAFENSLAKLSAYGVTADLDSVSGTICSVYSRILRSDPSALNSLCNIERPFLVSIGLGHDLAVSSYAQRRLEIVYAYASKSLRRFSIDDQVNDLLLSSDQKAELHVPTKWHDKHIWKQELNYLLPNCYDFYLFSYMRGHQQERAVVLQFVHTPKFQRLCKLREFERSYGWDSQKKYCWSTWEMPYFHGYHGFDSDTFSPNKFLLYLDLTSNYPNAANITWFKEGLAHLERYRKVNGRYCFPSRYLPERTNGYYLYSGARMRLAGC